MAGCGLSTQVVFALAAAILFLVPAEARFIQGPEFGRAVQSQRAPSNRVGPADKNQQAPSDRVGPTVQNQRAPSNRVGPAVQNQRAPPQPLNRVEISAPDVGGDTKPFFTLDNLGTLIGGGPNVDLVAANMNNNIPGPPRPPVAARPSGLLRPPKPPGQPRPLPTGPPGPPRPPGQPGLPRPPRQTGPLGQPVPQRPPVAARPSGPLRPPKPPGRTGPPRPPVSPSPKPSRPSRPTRPSGYPRQPKPPGQTGSSNTPVGVPINRPGQGGQGIPPGSPRPLRPAGPLQLQQPGSFGQFGSQGAPLNQPGQGGQGRPPRPPGQTGPLSPGNILNEETDGIYFPGQTIASGQNSFSLQYPPHYAPFMYPYDQFNPRYPSVYDSSPQGAPAEQLAVPQTSPFFPPPINPMYTGQPSYPPLYPPSYPGVNQPTANPSFIPNSHIFPPAGNSGASNEKPWFLAGDEESIFTERYGNAQQNDDQGSDSQEGGPFPQPTVNDPAAIPNKSPYQDGLYPSVPFLQDSSPLKYDKDECITSDGELGECHSAEDCGYTNGVVNGPCHQGMDGSPHARVCCIYPSYCGFETNREVTYFKNPDYPRHTNNTDECHFRVSLLPDVCQLRVDFVDLTLKPLQGGECDPENVLIVSSPRRQALVPLKQICGKVHDEDEDPTRTDLSHMYIHMDEIPLDSEYVLPPNTPEPWVDFKVKVKDYDSRWNIRISQIKCDGAPLQAPSGCSQWYNSVSGNLTSININDGNYQNNIKMSLCIKPDPTACALRYLIKEMSVGPVRYKKDNKPQLGYGLTCRDYLSFNGLQSSICGSAFNKEIILPITGIQGFSMVTDRMYEGGTDVGFRIDYSFLHSCDPTSFYKFPTAK